MRGGEKFHEIFFSTFLAELGNLESFETMLFLPNFFTSFGQVLVILEIFHAENFLENNVIVILKVQQTS